MLFIANSMVLVINLYSLYTYKAPHLLKHTVVCKLFSLKAYIPECLNSVCHFSILYEVFV